MCKTRHFVFAWDLTIKFAGRGRGDSFRLPTLVQVSNALFFFVKVYVGVGARLSVCLPVSSSCTEKGSNLYNI